MTFSLRLDMIETLRYLGYTGQELPPDIKEQILGVQEELALLARPKYVTRTFEIAIQDEGVQIVNTPLFLPGQNIKAHLKDCKNAILIAATLGFEVDQVLRRAEINHLSKALILNACANTGIEELCDWIQATKADEIKGFGQALTSRFSPGYGDLPLEIQGKFLEVLDAPRKIGLHCTSSLMLTPLKSVTAIMGVLEQSNRPPQINSCETCKLLSTCDFKKRGNSCGK